MPLSWVNGKGWVFENQKVANVGADKAKVREIIRDAVLTMGDVPSMGGPKAGTVAPAAAPKPAPAPKPAA